MPGVPVNSQAMSSGGKRKRKQVLCPNSVPTLQVFEWQDFDQLADHATHIHEFGRLNVS